MAKDSQGKCKLCRREGEKLFLKGERCFSSKCPIEKKGAVPPGEHGRRRRRRPSDYGLQLREKQKAKRIFGVRERQFKRYYQQATVTKKGAGLRLMQILESRLDNVVFRGGLVPSRSVARQLVRHGFVLVDDQKVDIPSYQVEPGQVVSLKTKGLKLDQVKETLKEKRPTPGWLKRKAAVVKIERLPEKDEVESSIDETLIIEFYSR